MFSCIQLPVTIIPWLSLASALSSLFCTHNSVVALQKKKNPL